MARQKNQKNILTKEQIGFLEFAGSNPIVKEDYYLTGGTPLSAFYLHHRYSEDLDFFTEKKEVNLLAIQKFMKAAQEKFPIKKIGYQNYQGLHMFFLHYRSGPILKVDFNYYPFPQIEKGVAKFNINIDSLHDIAVNKIQTIATRTSARDFIDLFFIVKNSKFTINKLIKDARAKFDWYIEPIQFGKQFLKVEELDDMPKMTIPVQRDELQDFFVKEAKILSTEILESD